MARDARACLWDARHGCPRIARFLLGVNLDAYAANDLVRSAVEQPFEIIGEALSQLSKPTIAVDRLLNPPQSPSMDSRHKRRLHRPELRAEPADQHPRSGRQHRCAPLGWQPRKPRGTAGQSDRRPQDQNQTRPDARRDLRLQHPKDRGWYFDVADWIEADGFSQRASGPCLPRTRARVRRAQQEPIHGV